MGNFSKDPQTVLQDSLAKGYSQVRFQQGKPVLDRELNLLGDLSNPQRLLIHHVGNGVPTDSDGFRISGLDAANNDFTIEAGRCLVGGYEVVLAANTTYKNQPHPVNVTNLPSGTSRVYLRVFSSEVTGAQDADLLNSDDVGFETAVREKVEWEVLVTTATIPTADHFHLAVLDTTADSIEDRRRTGLTVAAIQDELHSARGSASELNDRLNKSLAPDGTLGDNSVGNAQLADASVNSAKIANGSIKSSDLANKAVTATKLQSHPSDSAKRAVGKEHIQDGAVSLAQLNSTLVLDVEVSLPPAAPNETSTKVLNIQKADEHAFYLISVHYKSPRLPFLPGPYVEWTRRSQGIKPLTGTSLHRHQLVLKHRHSSAISVSCRAYRLLDT